LNAELRNSIPNSATAVAKQKLSNALGMAVRVSFTRHSNCLRMPPAAAGPKLYCHDIIFVS